MEIRDVTAWRKWLAHNGSSAREVWLALPRGGPLRYEEAVGHALCFGWIDGLYRRGEGLRFTPRGPRSTWSARNRDRADRMVALGLMTPAGQAVIDAAKASGAWRPDAVPADLRALFDENPVARDNFAAFPPSARRLVLEWVAGARRAETRRRRLAETVAKAAVGVRAR
jgi:uncharacterized protein YdeI (YjbR/CyaY-like superfamily)